MRLFHDRSCNFNLQRWKHYLDDESGGGGDNLDLGLPVLDGQLDRDLQEVPIIISFSGKTSSVCVTLRPFHSCVALAMSSPIFLGERPSGPTLGARAEVAATSPPTARRQTVCKTKN